MNEMIRRVAYAIADNPINWLDYVGRARDAISAMREPTDDMLNLARNIDEVDVTDLFSEMIDEALAD